MEHFSQNSGNDKNIEKEKKESLVVATQEKKKEPPAAECIIYAQCVCLDRNMIESGFFGLRYSV